MGLSLWRELLPITWELALKGSSDGLGKVQTQSCGHDGLVLVVACHTLETQEWRGSRAKEPMGKGLDLLLCEHGLDTLGLTGRACEICEIPSGRVMKGTAAHSPIQHRASGQGRGYF